MTVNLVPQLAIQKTTTLRELERMFDPEAHPQRAGLTLSYHQVIDDRTFLAGDLCVRGTATGDAFMRRGVVRTGPYWHYHCEDWRIFSDDVDHGLDLPERGQALREPLLAQRRGLETLVPRLYELHEIRTERIKSHPEYAHYVPNVRSAIGDLPAVDYLEALGLLGNATFTLTPYAMIRMAYGTLTRRMEPEAPGSAPKNDAKTGKKAGSKAAAAVDSDPLFVDGVRQDGGY